MAISKDLLEILVCPVCKADGGAEAGPERPEVRPMPSRLSHPRRYSRHAGGRGEDRRIDRSGKRSGMSAARRPGGCDPAAVAGRLRPHHSRARHSETLPPGPAARRSGGGPLPRRLRRAIPISTRSCRRQPRALRRWRPRLCLNLHGGTRSAWLTASLRRAVSRRVRALPQSVRLQRAHPAGAGDSGRGSQGPHRRTPGFRHVLSRGRRLCEIPRARLCARAATVGSGACRDPPGGVHPDKTWPAGALPRGCPAPAQTRPGTGLHRRRRGRPVAPSVIPYRRRSAARGNQASAGRGMLFVGNDSGPAHMAAAFGVPVVVIFGASDPAIWGPWRTASEVVTSPSGIAGVESLRCSPRWSACGCPHEGIAAAARLRPPLLASPGRVGDPDGRRGRRPGHGGAADRPDLRPRSQPRPARRMHPAAVRNPSFDHQLYLDQVVPLQGRNIWTMVAFAILAVLPGQGHLRLPGQLPGQLRRLFRGHGPAQRRLRQGAGQGAAVFRSALHRPADVVHHERHRQDPGGHLAYPGGFPAAVLQRHRAAASWW